jgi:PASTA domain-containing protein
VATIVSLIAGGSFRDEVVVPDVVGVDVYSAYDVLREAGFAIRIEEPIASGGPSVTEQSVAPGRTAPRGGIIVLELSKNGVLPLGLLPPGGFTERMPNLVGKSLPEAAETLAHEGLRWGTGPLPALPAGSEPTLLHNYEVSTQEPKPGRPFTATIWRETAEGDLITETTTVGLSAKLREQPSPG